MKRREAILRVGNVLVLAAILMLPVHSLAATATTSYVFAPTPDVIITELQTSTKHGAGQEFVELYNNTNSDIDLADSAHAGKGAWKLQYFSKTKLPALLAASSQAAGWVSPFRTIALSGVIPAGDYYVLAGDGYVPGSIEPDQTYTGTLSDDGGALQLVDSSITGSTTLVTVHDRLAWSGDTTLAPNAVLYSAPGSGPSLQRLPNNNSAYINADATMTTFTAAANISPKNPWTPPAEADPISTDPGTTPIGEGGLPTGDGTATPPQNGSSNGPLALVLTELLPNPASPQTDESDEYIELYNPNSTPFNLKGYTLETGETTLHDFTFTGDTVLAPNSYQPFYSVETRLSLSNIGGQARLLDTKGTKVSETSVYSNASDGMAWALDEVDGTWKWTTASTPGAANLILVAAVATKKVVVRAAAVKSIKKTAVKGVSTTKTKKAPTVKKPKAKSKAKLAKSTVTANSAARAPAPIHPGLLAAVAALAVGYGVYEYRHDLANRIYQFRTNRAARRAAGK